MAVCLSEGGFLVDRSYLAVNSVRLLNMLACSSRTESGDKCSKSSRHGHRTIDVRVATESFVSSLIDQYLSTPEPSFTLQTAIGISGCLHYSEKRPRVSLGLTQDNRQLVSLCSLLSSWKHGSTTIRPSRLRFFLCALMANPTAIHFPS